MSLGIRRRARKAKPATATCLCTRAGTTALPGTLVDAGQLQPVVDSSYPFARIAEAFAALEQGHAKGKIVVTF